MGMCFKAFGLAPRAYFFGGVGLSPSANDE